MSAGQRLARFGRRVFLLQSILTLSSSSAILSGSRQIAFTPAFPNMTRRTRGQSSRQSFTSVADPETASGTEWNLLLPYEDGSHNSAKVRVPRETTGDDSPFGKDVFKSRLDATIASCRQLNKSSIWIDVPMSQGSLLEELYTSGLRFHHAEGDVASLFLWLQDSKCRIPEYATHHVVSPLL